MRSASDDLPEGVDPEKLDAALDRALAAQHFDASLKGMLRKLVLDPDDSYRECCGNDCYVCMLPLGRAVDDVRREIAYDPSRESS
ncbi:MAG: hypothetical protein CSA62_10410 [Planctomycetota bacterium]|nr:MAG: hypothetical protein CSA62_10410 [Planctomycetota bacterium]